ncbi:MAG: AcrB/AcrD/AcrF family protein, partial [Myxococcales bacterium]|nr:AcrB/AcrD/AcrF family protein [Myxococcales bacterium]
PGVILNFSTGVVGPDISGPVACLERPKPEVASPGAIARMGTRVRASFEGAVTSLCASWWRSLAVVVVTVAVAVGVGWKLLPKMEYLPTGNRNLIFGIIVPAPGYNPTEMERMGAQVQDQMSKHTGQDVGGVPAISRSFFVGEPSQVFAGSVAEDPNRVKDLLNFVRGVH